MYLMLIREMAAVFWVVFILVVKGPFSFKSLSVHCMYRSTKSQAGIEIRRSTWANCLVFIVTSKCFESTDRNRSLKGGCMEKLGGPRSKTY